VFWNCLAPATHADLTGALFTGADLSNAVFCNTTMPNDALKNSDCSSRTSNTLAADRRRVGTAAFGEARSPVYARADDRVAAGAVASALSRVRAPGVVDRVWSPSTRCIALPRSAAKGYRSRAR
jgi:hypothetical protein